MYSLKKNDNPLLKLLAEKKDKEKNKNMLDLQRKLKKKILKKIKSWEKKEVKFIYKNKI